MKSYNIPNKFCHLCNLPGCEKVYFSRSYSTSCGVNLKTHIEKNYETVRIGKIAIKIREKTRNLIHIAKKCVIMRYQTYGTESRYKFLKMTGEVIA